MSRIENVIMIKNGIEFDFQAAGISPMIFDINGNVVELFNPITEEVETYYAEVSAGAIIISC